MWWDLAMARFTTSLSRALYSLLCWHSQVVQLIESNPVQETHGADHNCDNRGTGLVCSLKGDGQFYSVHGAGGPNKMSGHSSVVAITYPITIDCRTLWPQRPSSSARKTKVETNLQKLQKFCTQLIKAFAAKVSLQLLIWLILLR